jgi:hypothetical protein
MWFLLRSGETAVAVDWITQLWALAKATAFVGVALLLVHFVVSVSELYERLNDRIAELSKVVETRQSKDGYIRQDGVSWKCQDGVAAGPFCPDDLTPLGTIRLGGARTDTVTDDDCVNVLTSLYCNTCTATYKLGCRETIDSRTVRASRDAATRRCGRDAKARGRLGGSPPRDGW